MEYNFNKIEKKWQKAWEKEKVFEVNIDKKKKKFYVLDMFPYPSGKGLHIGHAFVFTLGDIYARFKRMHGFNVLYPMGYDSLGLPAENAAIKVGIHPEEYTKNSIVNFRKQQNAMGWSYDWSRTFKTSDPNFYKWDQWIFLKMLEKGIAYRKKAPVNWCSDCNTVLANEQVVNGKCWRHEDKEIEIKHLEQWFFRITNYAEELLQGLEKINWSQRVKTMQKNWIGKSYGTEIEFEIVGINNKWPIFTTRPDTIFGVTFMVVSAQHMKLNELVTKEQKKDVDKFLKKIKTVSKKSFKDSVELEKEGVFTGSYAINPLTKEEIPIYAGNFVLADYGSGMVMAVPAHDKRDFSFAKKYKIKIKEVIKGGNIKKESYTGEGILINSEEFNGLNSKDAKIKIIKYLEKKNLGKKTIQFKLKDWLISRQRYWGTPIPIIYCNDCGIVPVSEKNLPVKLPEKVKFGKGNPLETNEDWINVKCPKCEGNAKRETDTLDTFANSSWYYLRYCDSKNNNEIFNKKNVDYWAPIDQYIGGPEHITAHLIYIRFYTKFLRDLGLLKFDEPALKYFTQGIVKGPDGEKMSKSRGNIVEPSEMIEKYGADSLRLYLISNSSSDKDFDWNPNGIQSSFKFLNKVYDYFNNFKSEKINNIIESKINNSIKKITEDIENFKHNLAIIKLRELFNNFSEKNIDKKTAEKFLKMFYLYCPFITEEIWHKLENKSFINFEKWPEVDESKINVELEKQEQLIEKLIIDINHIFNLIKEKENKEMKKVFIYVLPNEKESYLDNLEIIKNKIDLDINIYSVADKEKYDPENKSKKVKPGRPGIYLE